MAAPGHNAPVAWTRGELAAASALLRGPGAVTVGYDGHGVDIDGDDLVVRFGWRQHPRTFQVRISLSEPGCGPWTGVPTSTAAEWINEVSGLLMEELDTGATHWAMRRERDGAIELDLEAGPPSRSPYFISEARSIGAWWLAEQGLDSEDAVAAEAAGTVRTWLQMYVDNTRGEPVVAQVLIVDGAEPGSARVATFQAVADVPLPDLTRLAHHGLCAAAEAGAQRITSPLPHPALLAAGMQVEGPELQLDALNPWPLPDALRQPR
jgi:hypothetical protein